jgi:hypothetical protein
MSYYAETGRSCPLITWLYGQLLEYKEFSCNFLQEFSFPDNPLLLPGLFWGAKWSTCAICISVRDLKSRNVKSTGRIFSADLSWGTLSSGIRHLQVVRHFGKMKSVTLTCISLFEISRLSFSHCFRVLPDDYWKNFFNKNILVH